MFVNVQFQNNYTCLPHGKDSFLDPPTPLKIPSKSPQYLHFFKIFGLRELPFPTPQEISVPFVGERVWIFSGNEQYEAPLCTNCDPEKVYKKMSSVSISYLLIQGNMCKFCIVHLKISLWSPIQRQFQVRDSKQTDIFSGESQVLHRGIVSGELMMDCLLLY